MSFSIYTYSNPYAIDKEMYWDSIKNCPHFCVSQTMANGIMETYGEMFAGKVSTVENLVKGLFAYWESMECRIKQYADVDNAIGQLKIFSEEENIRQALRFNRKDLSNSLRILFELGMDLDEMRTELMSEEQKYLLMLYRTIIDSDMHKDFLLKSDFTESEIEEAVKRGMLLEREESNLSNIDFDSVVIHGVHQFSPIILQTLEQVAKYKRVVLLFNYQNQYKNVYQTWIDVYSLFDLPIRSQFINEFKPNPLLGNCFAGNQLADRMANLIEGKVLDERINTPVEIIEFDNNTEFASYISKIYENALVRQERNRESKRSTLYYMREQFYAANNSVNNILKVYYPEQFGERHFLTYPLGHFFLSLTNMWDPEGGGLHIDDMNDIVECLSSGMINVKSTVKLSTIFTKTREFFLRAETIDQIVSLLAKLKKRILKAEKDKSEKEICNRLVYYDVTIENIDALSDALKQLDQIARLFYADFEDDENNFREFYRKIRDFLENRVLEAEDLEEDFRDVVRRVLQRLEDVDCIEAAGTFDVLKETMLYYLKQEGKKGLSANWIVRDFEQIDGDILKSRGQNPDTIYHFACVSDADMNVTNRDRFPWPLDVNFFEVAQDPLDWKYQVYVKSRKEYKNFKRYALIYGLQFNRAKFKVSYVKNVDDRENEIFYLLRILGANKTIPEDWHDNKNFNDMTVRIYLDEDNRYQAFDYYRYKICKYRFLLESTIGKRPVFKDHFLLLKYLEILLENKARIKLQGQIATEDVVLEILNDEFRILERKFEFVRGMHTERMDVIANARDYLFKSILNGSHNFPQVSEKDEIYMKKREEFIYLRLDDPAYSSKFKEVPNEEIRKRLTAVHVNDTGYAKSCGDWCRYCADREICLEPYKHSKIET